MSTKINVRSPFYLNLTEPTVPQPTFTCGVANISGLSVDQQGQISTPSLSFGTIDTITSTAGDFSNGKFATVSVATSRTITIRILIPAGFSNVSSGYIDCDQVVTQPAYVPSGPAPSCSGGPTTNGTIPSQTLGINGDSTTIDLSSYFTAGSQAIAGYNISNTATNVVNTSLSGSTLTISSNTIGGSATIHVSAYDNAVNSCTATQSFDVTVSAPSTNFACTNSGIEALQGGSIAQDGTITNPTGPANITAIKETSGGATITSYSANNTGSDRSVTLYFDLTAPAGYANAGSTIECSKTFIQPAGLPTFDCQAANLYEQQISTRGSVKIGFATLGTIQSFTPISFDPVDVDTARSVTFTVLAPSGYSNSGSTIDCTKSITQPAQVATCGSNAFYLSAGLSSSAEFCGGVYYLSTAVLSTGTIFGLGASVCKRGTPFNGGDLYYAVSTSKVNVGVNLGKFLIWKIDSNGIIQDVLEWNCGAGDDGNGRGASL